ncbi:MAG: hypothetical protein MPJ50_10525 [Pirellulales bacterium]|nr:hypothetical protein [Pirellulales bacterium]
MERKSSFLSLALIVVVVGGICWSISPSSSAAPLVTQDQQGPANLDQAFPNLVKELKGIDGCLGVEQATTQSGKSVIFAWFKDKAATMRWYESEYHQTMMYRFFPNQEFGKAMEGIADDSGPIMAIASVTPATSQKVGQLPISQIAIELYGPLKGGLAIGGAFAPNAVGELLKAQHKENAAADR